MEAGVWIQETRDRNELTYKSERNSDLGNECMAARGRDS